MQSFLCLILPEKNHRENKISAKTNIFQKQKENFFKGKIKYKEKLLPFNSFFFFFYIVNQNKYLVVLFPIVGFSLVCASNWCVDHRS